MRTSLKRLAFVPVAMLFATQLAGCSASAGIKPSETTCTRYLQDMKTHQLGAAYSQLSSSCKKSVTQQQMQDIWDYVEKNHGKVQSWSQTGFRIYSGTGGSYVNLGYSITCKQSAASITFSCVEENSKWLIHGFNVK